MIEIFDVDELFTSWLTDFITTEYSDLTAEEIERKMPEIYDKFNDVKVAKLGDKTVLEYFSQFSVSELIGAISDYIDAGVEPPCEMLNLIVDSDLGEEELASLLYDDNSLVVLYAMRLLSDKNSKVGLSQIFNIMLNYSDETNVELATEILIENADEIKDEVLSQYYSVSEELLPNLEEILASTKGDDRVLDLLVNAFNNNPNQLLFYTQLLKKFGDERALEVLNKKIEDPTIDYADYQELRSAIESLGGVITTKRDFTTDAVYGALKKAEEELDN